MGDGVISDLSRAGSIDSPAVRINKLFTIPNIILAVSILLIVIYFFSLSANKPSISAQAIVTPEMIKPKLTELYFFYDGSPTCGKCIEAKSFLDTLKRKNPKVALRSYEVSFDPDNELLLRDFSDKYDVPSPVVLPIIFINDRYFKDFSSRISLEVEAYVEELTSSDSE
jgi:hypothetical protein